MREKAHRVSIDANAHRLFGTGETSDDFLTVYSANTFSHFSN
jgi:hypothetical protein